MSTVEQSAASRKNDNGDRSRCMYLNIFFTLMLLSITTPLFALEPIIIDDSLKNINLGTKTEFLEDKNGSLDIETVSRGDYKWNKSEKKSFNFGFTSSAYWFRFIVENKQVKEQGWYLEIDYPMIDFIDLYIEDANGSWIIHRTGDHYPFNAREIKDRNFIFQIDKITGTSSIFMRLKTSSGLNFSPSAWSIKEFIHRMNIELPLIWIYYGVMIIMVFYNLFLFFSVRTVKYIYYSLFITFFTIFQLTLNGLAFQYLWPNSIWWANNSLPFFICVALCWACIFISKHINFWENFPVIGKITLVSIIIPNILWSILSLLLSYRVSVVGATVIAGYTPIILFVCSIYCVIKKNRASRYVLLGFTFLAIGITLFVLKTFGFLGTTILTNWSISLGGGLLVVILSLSLADEINVMKNKLQDLNLNLENEVKHRTIELQQDRNILKEWNENMERQLILAKKIQQKLIPVKKPTDFIFSLYKPMEKVGGDFLEFIHFRETDKIGIFISDVSGHGIPAALITSMIKTTLAQAGKLREDPAGFLLYLNEMLLHYTANNFITAIYAVFDPQNKHLLYSIAGHNPPFLISKDIIDILKNPKSVPLAIMSESALKKFNKSFCNYDVQLNNYDKILFYTDGLTEARSITQNEEYFEDTAMEKIIIENMHFPCTEFIENLYNGLLRFRGSDDFDDDICIICIDL